MSLAAFISDPYDYVKNLSAAVNGTKSATRNLLRGEDLNQKQTFLHKICLI